MHGLAGSGTLTVLTLVSLPTTLDRMLYAAVFGAGSVVGMGGLAGCASVVAARFTRGPSPLRLMPAAAGVLSVIMGLAWGCAILRATVL